jgi:hypothetical protein
VLVSVTLQQHHHKEQQQRQTHQYPMLATGKHAQVSLLNALLAGLIQAEPQMPPLAAPAAAASSSSSSSSAGFVQPSKAIQDAEGLKTFLQGSTVKSFVAFILSLNQAVAGEAAGQCGAPFYRKNLQGWHI